jgi:hypothetical protein
MVPSTSFSLARASNERTISRMESSAGRQDSGKGVRVGGTGVSVGGNGVKVGGAGVDVGGIRVGEGGAFVKVGSLVVISDPAVPQADNEVMRMAPSRIDFHGLRYGIIPPRFYVFFFIKVKRN